MSEWTDRQYRAVLADLEDDWNRPSKSDFYQMQTAFQVTRGYARNPGAVKMEHFRLEFRGKVEHEVDPVKATRAAQARWLAWVSPRDGGEETRGERLSPHGD